MKTQTKEQSKTLGYYITNVHNLIQSVGWLAMLAMMIIGLLTHPAQNFGSMKKNMPNVVLFYQVIQTLQGLEVLYALMGWSNTSVAAAVLQTFGRLIFGLVTLPLAPQDEPSVFFTLMCFSLAESNRYPYYYLKQLGLENSTAGRFFGWLRYSSFLVIYPLGAIGELLVAYSAIGPIRASSPKRCSVELPNKWNFAFHFDYFLLYVLPVVYLFGFPQNYMYMVSQRKKYFGGASQSRSQPSASINKKQL